MKISKKVIANIKSDLSNGKCYSLISLIIEADCKCIINEIKEQKLLTKVSASDRYDVYQHYREKIHQLYDGTEFITEKYYIDFIEMFAVEYDQLLAKFNSFFVTSTSDLKYDQTKLLDHFISNTFYNLEKNSNEYYQRNLDNLFTHDEIAAKVAVEEYFVHKLSGMRNDIVYASGRILINMFKGDKIVIRFTDSKNMSALVQVSSRINALDYILDGISYGEFRVDDFNHESKTEIVLNPCNLGQMKAKEFGIRRSHAEAMRPKAKSREVKEIFSQFTADVIKEILEEHKRTFSVKIQKKDFTEIYNVMDSLLKILAIEDEILLFAGNDYSIIPASYVVALTTLCHFVISCHILRKNKSIVRNHHKLYHISIRRVLDLAQKYSVFDRHVLSEAIDKLYQLSTESSYLNYSKSSFLAHNKDIIGLPSIINYNWAVWVRSRIVNGGDIGNFYGHLWEDYITWFFREYGWTVLGRNEIHKSGHSRATDTDIIVAKDDIALLIQVKVFVGGEQSLYDIWKARKVIAKGVRQAKLSLERFVNHEALKSLVRSQSYPHRIEKVLPIVLSNTSCHSGYINDGVYVLTTGDLLTILRGAKVTIHDQKMKILKEIRHASAATLATSEIEALITNPVNHRIALTREHYHIKSEFENFCVLVPSFT